MVQTLEALGLAEEALMLPIGLSFSRDRKMVVDALAAIRQAKAELEKRSLQEPKPPKWYTREEIIQVLARMNYCEAIAQELADWFVLHLQHSFNKGFQVAQWDIYKGKPQGHVKNLSTP